MFRCTPDGSACAECALWTIPFVVSRSCRGCRGCATTASPPQRIPPPLAWSHAHAHAHARTPLLNAGGLAVRHSTAKGQVRLRLLPTVGCAAQVMFATSHRTKARLRQTPRGLRVGNGAVASQPGRPAAEGGGRLPWRRGCQSQSLQPKRPAVFRATDDGCRMQGASDYCTALEENGDMNWSHVPALMRCIICSFM